MPDIASVPPPQVPIQTVLDEAKAAREAAANRTPSNSLDKDAFLKLLVAQLKYQDPSKPMDSTEFMSQNAQLTSVEKLTDLAEVTRAAFATQQRLAAAGLVGKQISWKATDGTTQSGTVTSASIVGDDPKLVVNGADVALSTVLSVTTPKAG